VSVWEWFRRAPRGRNMPFECRDNEKNDARATTMFTVAKLFHVPFSCHSLGAPLDGRSLQEFDQSERSFGISCVLADRASMMAGTCN